MYALGIDLGTTFTAAATWRAGRAEGASLGSRTAAIPSVVLLREDETMLTGETANRRALSEPHRVAREFKRRLGDTSALASAALGQRSAMEFVIAVVTGPRIGRRALAHVCPVADLDRIITDSSADEGALAELRSAGLQIDVVEAPAQSA